MLVLVIKKFDLMEVGPFSRGYIKSLDKPGQFSEGETPYFGILGETTKNPLINRGGLHRRGLLEGSGRLKALEQERPVFDKKLPRFLRENFLRMIDVSFEEELKRG